MPSLLSENWTLRAGEQHITDALTRLALEVQPSIIERDARLGALVRRLQKRSYSKGEILYAVDELADNPDLDDKLRYGGDLSAADFRRVIEPIRETRRRLMSGEILTEGEMWRAAETVPELSTEDFGQCRDQTHDRRFTLKSEARERLGDGHD